MRALLSVLTQVYTRWRFVEDTDAAKPHGPAEGPADETARLRESIARERRNLDHFRRFNCAGLAGPCESSIRAMEGRIRALEMGARRAI
jgi:hypothetical protein